MCSKSLPSYKKEGSIDITYLLQLDDNYGQHLWEVSLGSSEPMYVPKKPQYKFLTTGIRIDYETNVLQLKISSKDELKNSILKRVVLVEKIKYKSLPPMSGDPIIDWSLKQLFSSNIFGNSKNFKLLKMDKSGNVINTWLLSECSLLNSTLWTDDYTGGLPMTLFNQTIWIKPNSILQF